MTRLLHLVLLIALTIGATFAPDVSLASTTGMSMVQTDIGDGEDGPCGGCVSPEVADGIPCKGGCPAPCAMSGAASAIMPMTSSVQFAPACDVIVAWPNPPIARDITLGFDPFPPKLPI